MFSTSQELFSWLATSSTNVERFLHSLEKIMKGDMVLILGNNEEIAVTAFRPYKKNLRVRK